VRNTTHCRRSASRVGRAGERRGEEADRRAERGEEDAEELQREQLRGAIRRAKVDERYDDGQAARLVVGVPGLLPVDCVAVRGRRGQQLQLAPIYAAPTFAVAEEALRDGTTPLVILEISQPMGLIQGRRLQLSARAGKSTGLCLIPDGMGSNAAESRWHAAPIFDPFSAPGDSTLQRYELIKNKSGTLGFWHVRWDTASRRLHLVSATGE